MALRKAVFRSFACCKLSIVKGLVGASGFEPPSSWSRTSLDQAKSVELTAFACAFPRLIWATWATKYRWPDFKLLAVAHVQIALFLERMKFWRNTAGEVFSGCDPHPPHDINGGCVVFLKARLESGKRTIRSGAS